MSAKCPTCNKYLSPIDFINTARIILPENLEFYDFGGGNEVAPMPDYVQEGGHYRDGGYLAGLIDIKTEKVLYFKLGAAGQLFKGSAEDILKTALEAVKAAIARFPEASQPGRSPLNLAKFFEGVS